MLSSKFCLLIKNISDFVQCDYAALNKMFPYLITQYDLTSKLPFAKSGINGRTEASFFQHIPSPPLGKKKYMWLKTKIQKIFEDFRC